MNALVAMHPAQAEHAAPVQLLPSPRARTRKRTIYLSHSARELFTTCGRKYRYSHVDRLEPIEQSANLGFGKAFHRGAEVFLIYTTTGQRIADPIEEFDKVWDEFCNSHIVDYSSRWDKETLRSTGHRLLEVFMKDWKARGLMVVLDAEGKPVLERKLKIALPDDVVFTSVIDVLAITPDGRVIVVDLKTPAQAAFSGFVDMSEQLLGYQVAVDAHAEALAIERVDGRAFYECIKVPIPKTSRGAGPHVAPMEIAGRANDDDIRDWILETIAIANDIRAGRFPKRPGDAFSSPCAMCPAGYVGKCRTGSMEGLRSKPPYRPEPVSHPMPSGPPPF